MFNALRSISLLSRTMQHSPAEK